jgi:GNAT superfamily N-acetyltransferase
MQIQIRKAGLQDLKHILHHRRAMFEEMGFRDASVLAAVDDVSEKYFKEVLPTGAYEAWMAEDSNGQVVGGGGIVVAAWPGFPGENLAERAWILNMYTEPEARGRGVARRLMETMLSWCRQQGYGAVHLHASAAGRSIYKSLGFQQTNEMSLKLK